MNDATSGMAAAGSSTNPKASSRARSAGSPTDEVVGPARPATSDRTDSRTNDAWLTDGLSRSTPRPSPKSDEPGSAPAAGAEKDAPTGLVSMPSKRPSGRWNAPRDVMELAAQANVLATQVLNGEVPITTARTYASVARSIASLLKAEIERRRWVDGPELSFPNDEVFDE